jgi:hypothetical protein
VDIIYILQVYHLARLYAILSKMAMLLTPFNVVLLSFPMKPLSEVDLQYIGIIGITPIVLETTQMKDENNDFDERCLIIEILAPMRVPLALSK